MVSMATSAAPSPIPEDNSGRYSSRGRCPGLSPGYTFSSLSASLRVHLQPQPLCFPNAIWANAGRASPPGAAASANCCSQHSWPPSEPCLSFALRTQSLKEVQLEAQTLWSPVSRGTSWNASDVRNLDSTEPYWVFQTWEPMIKTSYPRPFSLFYFPYIFGRRVSCSSEWPQTCYMVEDDLDYFLSLMCHPGWVMGVQGCVLYECFC